MKVYQSTESSANKDMKDKKRHTLLIFISFFTLVFVATFLIRYLGGNPSLPGNEAYFTLGTERNFFTDNEVINKNDLQNLIWPYLVHLLSTLTRVEIAIVILSYIFAILSILIIYGILQRLNFENKNIFLLLFVISPITIWLFTTLSGTILPSFLCLLTLYLLLSEKDSVALFTLTLTILFGLVATIGVLLLILAFSRRYKFLFYTLGMGMVINAIYYYFVPIPLFSKFEIANFFSLFSSLSSFGIGFFIFLLSMIGIIATWRVKAERKRYFTIYASFIALVLLSMSNKLFLFYVTFPLIYLSTIGFVTLVRREWQSKSIKVLTLAIIFAGLAINFVYTPVKVSQLEPSKEVLESLTWFQNEKEGSVLSHPDNGYFLEVIANKKVFVNNYEQKTSSYIAGLATEIFLSRDLEYLNRNIEEFNIEYIYITPDMKAGKVWKSDDEGLLFLLRYGGSFKNIYRKDGIEIWQRTRGVPEVEEPL